MIKKLMAVILCAAMLAGCLLKAAPVKANEKLSLEEIVSGMTLDEKISQMIMPAIRTWNGTNVTDLAAADGLAEALAKHQYGGIILSASNISTAAQSAKLVSDLQKNNAGIETGTNIPYFISADEEGGIVTRLTCGTRMTGSMAIGATGENAEINAALTAQVIASELEALGININNAPDIDVNSNPDNPVIGTRSFSDDPETVSKLGITFGETLEENGVIAVYKHFPGHGDTGTDSHIGTASVNKTYEQLMENEFIPFIAAIEAGADMIMTAHITLPLVDDEQTFANGEKGYYPATMSKKIMTGILREDLGFQGVIITDALEMAAIAEAGLVPGEKGSAEYFVNIAEKVINAGVDILLCPVDMTSADAAAFYDDYIEGIAALVESGVISGDRIDESVLRILKLKDKYGILDMDTSGENVEEIEAYAELVVGCSENHAAEMEIAKQAITMVKNDGTLPVSSDAKNIVLVGRSKADTIALGYAVDSLKKDGLIDESAYVQNLGQGTESGSAESDTRITIDYYYVSYSKPVNYTDELKAAIEAADIVVTLACTWDTDDLSEGYAPYEGITGCMNDAYASGAKFVLLSTNLPYDCARYQLSDAILLAYMSSGTGTDPTARNEYENANAYNANIIAAVEIIFGKQSPEGTLPVNIPKVADNGDGTVHYTDELLYERGFGIGYEEDVPDGLANEPDGDGNWYYYKDGAIAYDVTTVAHNNNGWWRVEDGKVNFNAAGIYQNENGWWRVEDGKVNFGATGIYQNENGWWRVENGRVNFEADGIYQNENGWWKTTNGKVTFDETGVFHNENGWWRVVGSKVDFAANGIYQNENGWWKTTNGKVTFDETGIFQNENGWWYVKDSKVRFDFSGTFVYNGTTYTVKNGRVQ